MSGARAPGLLRRLRKERERALFLVWSREPYGNISSLFFSERRETDKNRPGMLIEFPIMKNESSLGLYNTRN